MDVLLMKMDPEIRGTCALAGHNGEIELLSFSHGVARQGADDKAGKVNHQDFTITKHLDDATPALGQALAHGTVFRTVEVLVGRSEGGQVFPLIKYTLGHVVISSVAIGGGGGAHPVETVSMIYDQIQFVFDHQNPADSGAVQTLWELTKEKN